MVNCTWTDMRPTSEVLKADGVQSYSGEFEADASGRRGFTVRVIPRDDRLIGTLLPGRITWYRGDPGSPGIRYGSDSAWAHEIEERRAPVASTH